MVDEVKRSIFELNQEKFRQAIAKDIPIGKKNAITSRKLNALYVKSGVSAKERNTKTSRIRTALMWWVELQPNTGDTIFAQASDDKTPVYYWEDVTGLNQALNQELSGNMSLSKALAYNLVRENFSNLLPPSELVMLAPYFEAAERKLELLKNVSGDKINAAKYVPFCNQWKKEPINPDDYKAIFDAIEHKIVIRAKYSSMHSGLVPDEVIFSPQQILLQYEHTQVVGYLHNPIDGENIYRHFDINRLSDITEKKHQSYKQEHQPRKQFKLVALVHQWVRDKLDYVKLSEDQKITPWEELSENDLALCKKMAHLENYKWAKVEATIELTSKFLDHHDDFDAWFFVNSIAVFGADFIPLAPTQVVNEFKRRAQNAVDTYANLADEFNLDKK